MIIYYLKNEVNILCKKNLKPLYKVYKMLSKLRKINIFNVLSTQDNSLIVEKTVNFKLNNS